MSETASTASSDSGNADPVGPGSLPSGLRTLLGLGHVHTYGSSALKQNTDLAYYRRRKGFRLRQHASKSIRSKMGVRLAETMEISRYRTMVCSSVAYVEAISI